VHSYSKVVLSHSKVVLSHSKGVFSHSKGVFSYSKGVHSYSKVVHNYSKGVHSYSKGVHSYSMYAPVSRLNRFSPSEKGTITPPAKGYFTESVVGSVANRNCKTGTQAVWSR